MSNSKRILYDFNSYMQHTAKITGFVWLHKYILTFEDLMCCFRQSLLAWNFQSCNLKPMNLRWTFLFLAKPMTTEKTDISICMKQSLCSLHDHIPLNMMITFGVSWFLFLVCCHCLFFFLFFACIILKFVNAPKCNVCSNWNLLRLYRIEGLLTRASFCLQ